MKQTFKIGDKVVRTGQVFDSDGDFMTIGKEYTVRLSWDYALFLVGDDRQWSAMRFELSDGKEESVNKPHPYAEVIKAWADGAEVQYRLIGEEEWKNVIHPTWNSQYEYRVMPVKPDDIVIERHVHYTDYNDYDLAFLGFRNNVRFVFDGETRELKDVVKI